MNPELLLVRSLRRVLESVGQGRGVALSVVEELRLAPDPAPDSARRLLLGYPLRASLRVLCESTTDEVAMLASLIVAAPRSSAALVGEKGEELASTLEQWVKARDSRRLEQKVLKFRSVLTSGVLGAVTAMLASIGPLVGSLNLGGAPPVDPSAFLAGAAAMAAISSAMLGLFMSGKGFLLIVAVTVGVFAAVSAIASPLANVPAATMWGVK